MTTRDLDTTGCLDPKAVRRVEKLLRVERAAIPRMADLYRLLANPTRLKILLALSRTESLCVGDLARVLDLSVAATSHQLKMLKERGWLTSEGDGKWVRYCFASEGLRDALEGDLRLLKKSRRA